MIQPQAKNAEAPLLWSAGDIRQYAFCPRITYFRYVMPIAFRQTYNMSSGVEFEEVQLQLSRRRVFHRWGLSDAKLVPHPHWRSESLRLVGIPDAVLLAPERVGILEFKHTAHGLTRGTKLQLAVYELLARELYPSCEIVVLFHSVAEGRTRQVPITPGLRQEVLLIRDQLDAMFLSESLPEPAAQIGKCLECDYRRSCSDVLL